MFYSINCLFLFSLAVLSWTILCYFNQIEKYFLNGSNCTEGKTTDNPAMADQTIPAFVKTPTYRYNYEIYVNFLSIFACIYALAKITNIAETYVAKTINRRLYVTSRNEDFESEAMDDSQNQLENLLIKISKLEKQNQELKYKLREVEDSQIPQQSLEESIHKIYISNRHIHLNRQVYVNNMKFQTHAENRENANEIWEKYLNMRNMTLKNPISPKKNDPIDVNMPVVLSNEELKSIKAKV